MDKKNFDKFPLKRLKPVDGIAVTANLWDEAHEYHRLQQRYHDLLCHGSGIVAGLEVIASDPADLTIYVLPGFAIDPNGELIVIREPVAFDFNKTQGLLYLVLTYAESRAEQETNGGPLYIRSQFGLEAGTEFPDVPYLELARVRRTKLGTITDPESPELPGENEIDQRYRIQSGRSAIGQNTTASIAVCHTGKPKSEVGAHGCSALARSLNKSGLSVVVDNNVKILSNLEPYTLVYLVGHNGASLNREQMTSLYAYIQSGGTVFMESCRQDLAAGAQASDLVFTEMASSFGINLAELPAAHSLWVEPNLFGAPPFGFETEGDPQLLVGDGLIYSTFDYGCLWQSQRRGRTASREEIRSAHEWGENLIAFAQDRRRKALAK